jgi:hypothetical protein
VTPYLAIRPEAREALGDAGLAEVVRRLVPAAATLDRTMFACLLGATGLPEARAWLEERWKAAPAEHAQLAYGLAWLGDDAARAFFKPIFEDPTTLRPDLIAVPLARTGDAAGEAFLLEAVRAGRDDLLGVALPAAARIGSPALRRAIARRIRAETDLPEAVLVLAIEALRADASENATETLAGLASSRWPSVAGAARSALATRLPAAAVEAEIAASKLEAEGARALRALRAEEAAAMFARCVAASSLPRVEARLLAATALRLSGKAADAGRVAAEAESAAKEPADRRRAALARRCVSDPVIVPASAIGARVQVLEKPAKTVADQSIRVRLAITNDGSACWPGGPGPFAFWIDFACLDADGKRREAPESFPYGIHWLPEEGVLPGETVTVEFVDTVPAPAASDRFVLTLRQLDGAPEGQVLASW